MRQLLPILFEKLAHHQQTKLSPILDVFQLMEKFIFLVENKDIAFRMFRIIIFEDFIECFFFRYTFIYYCTISFFKSFDLRSLRTFSNFYYGRGKKILIYRFGSIVLIEATTPTWVLKNLSELNNFRILIACWRYCTIYYEKLSF